MVAIARSGVQLRGDLLLACVADEEGCSIGSMHLAQMGLDIDAAIVIEPQDTSELVVEHQGFGWIDVITHGVPAHGCVPEIGVDAIVHMAERYGITRMHKLDNTVFVPGASADERPHGVPRPAPISGGNSTMRRIRGGPCSWIEIGTQPGEHLSDRVAEIEAIFAEVAKTEPGFRGEVRVHLDREPFLARGHERLQEVLDRGDDAE